MVSRARPEIVAPAGDAKAMRAAVRSGADAVYFGLESHNARARAKNFAAATLGETMRELHASGVRGYVALNTLVFDAELTSVEAAIRACWDAGVDAVIVQDLGVMRLVRTVAPGLRIHASTQMTCTDAAGVNLARSLGASRAIVARELSTREIADIIAGTDVEIEVFVHGALCIAYSGQCLTSEAIGGRSANRGACAQACRLPYELVVDGVVRDLGDRAYLLSPQDLAASVLVPELGRLGVSALKIEGRLKGPEYVAAVTRLIRRALDGVATDGDRQSAEQTFSRGSGPGFLRGVDHQRIVDGRTSDHVGIRVGTARGARGFRGKDWIAVELLALLARGDGVLFEGSRGGQSEVGGRVWEIVADGRDVREAGPGSEAHVWLGPNHDAGAMPVAGARVWKTSDPANQRAIAARVEREPVTVTIDVHLRGRLGEPFVLEACSSRGHFARVVGDACFEVARQTPLTPQAIRHKLARLRDSPFSLGELHIDIPGGCILPISSLNRGRRALVDALMASLTPAREPAIARGAAQAPNCTPPDRSPPPPGLFVLCRSRAQALAAVDAGADGVVLDFLELTGTEAAVHALRARNQAVWVALAPPRIRKPGEEKIDKGLRDLAPDALMVRSLGALGEVRAANDGIARIGDYSLNVTNRLAAAEVLAAGLVAFTPAFDLDADQLKALCATSFGPWAEVVIHHPMPLFHMEHCLFAALLSSGHDHRMCGRPCETHVVNLRDRVGMDHLVEADVGCRNTVFHAAAQSAATVASVLVASGVGRFRIEVVRETAEDVVRLVHTYRALLEGRTSPGEVVRELRAGGGYGVVSGSLRLVHR
jgi:putative protease